VHQFCRLGKHAIIGGCSKVVQDVPPFMIVDGNPAITRGVNQIGLQRKGFSEEQIRQLKNAYKKLFLNKKQNLSDVIKQLEEMEGVTTEEVSHLIQFIQNSERGIAR